MGIIKDNLGKLAVFGTSVSSLVVSSIALNNSGQTSQVQQEDKNDSSDLAEKMALAVIENQKNINGVKNWLTLLSGSVKKNFDFLESKYKELKSGSKEEFDLAIDGIQKQGQVNTEIKNSIQNLIERFEEVKTQFVTVKDEKDQAVAEVKNLGESITDLTKMMKTIKEVSDLQSAMLYWSKTVIPQLQDEIKKRSDDIEKRLGDRITSSIIR